MTKANSGPPPPCELVSYTKSTENVDVLSLNSSRYSKSTDVVDAQQNVEQTLLPKKHGLTIWTAMVFVAGEMAGSGVLALPQAVVDAGWIGLVLIFMCCVNSGYTGTRLGRCWTILEERYPEYRDAVRSPYPNIALKAVGRKTSLLVTVNIVVTLFGTAVVFLLLVSQLIQGLLVDVLTMSYCYWVIIIGAVMIPLSWLGTPKDFWPLAVGAMISTTVACVLIVIRAALDYGERDRSAVRFPSADFNSFFLAFGTILFAFGGASTFPTIQNDMKQKEKFPKAVSFAFLILLLLYIPVAGIGYFTYGNQVNNNIVETLTQGPVTITIRILLALHLFSSFVIVINPFCQELEEHLKLPKDFTWKRCIFRTGMVGSIIFMAMSIPNFGKILALVGGSTITLMTFVFPPFFYMRLCDMEGSKTKISLHERIYLWELILIGVVGGAAASYSAVKGIIDSPTFASPCYVNPNARCFVDPHAASC